jgi:hypothetical protein
LAAAEGPPNLAEWIPRTEPRSETCPRLRCVADAGVRLGEVDGDRGVSRAIVVDLAVPPA